VLVPFRLNSAESTQLDVRDRDSRTTGEACTGSHGHASQSQNGVLVADEQLLQAPKATNLPLLVGVRIVSFAAGDAPHKYRYNILNMIYCPCCSVPLTLWNTSL
jgi:hypothetical protein